MNTPGGTPSGRGHALWEGAGRGGGLPGSGEPSTRAQCEAPATPSPRVQRAQVWPSRRALTFRHQAVVFILVQLDEGGVPAAVGCAEPAGGLCLPGWGQQRKEALILGGREGAARSGGREGILGGGRCRRQEQHCGAGNRPRMDPTPTPGEPARAHGDRGVWPPSPRARARGLGRGEGLEAAGPGEGGSETVQGGLRGRTRAHPSGVREGRRRRAASWPRTVARVPGTERPLTGRARASRRAGAAGARPPTSQRAGRATRGVGDGETDVWPGSVGGRVRVPACHAPAREDKEGRSDH